MSNKISLEGLDKAEVFAALYNGARAQGLGYLHYKATPMTPEQARNRFKNHFGFFDYVDGRVMKVDLSGNEFNPWLYDRDNGQGAAERIINTLRVAGYTNPEEAKTPDIEDIAKIAVLMAIMIEEYDSLKKNITP